VAGIFGIALELPFANLAAALQRPATYRGQVREARSIAQAVAAYPFGVLESAISTGIPSGDSLHDVPVIMVHGYGHNRSGWFTLDRRLRRSGFTSVHTFNYNPLTGDVPKFGAQLAERVDLLRTVTGQPYVHVIGHSLGGLVARWYVQEEGGDEAVHTAITVASPHEGTWTAAAGVLSSGARELLPRARVIRQLAAGARRTNVRWVAYYSNLDLLVQPGRSAMLSDPVLNATNVMIKDVGHLSIMLAPSLTRSVVEQLETAVALERVA
jgi:triacylglycerol esterase/lipase EstA (alpha/beta hydrolase family)